MKNKILISLAILIGFAPIQATIVRDVLETGKEIVKASYHTAQDAAEFVIENSWKAPIGFKKNGGKIAVTTAALILTADQVANWYKHKNLAKYPIYAQDGTTILGYDYVDQNGKLVESAKIYKTIPQRIINFYQKNPFIQNITLGLISMAIYTTFERHFSGKNFNPNQFKIATPDESFPTFQDIIGAESAKNKLQQISKFVKNKKNYLEMGAEPITGCILYGIPGTGKTELARAMAKEMELPLIHTNGSSFNTMWRGSGTAQLKQLEKEAKKLAPCIVFVDEIDNLVGKPNNFGWETDSNATTNTVKSMLDGFEKQDPLKRIFFVGATNNMSQIDPAILRNGRMPGIEVAAPTSEEFEKIIHHKLFKQGKFKADPSVNISGYKKIYKEGISTGADVSALLNEAAMKSVENKKQWIDQESFDQALQTLIKPAVESAMHSAKSTIFG